MKQGVAVQALDTPLPPVPVNADSLPYWMSRIAPQAKLFQTIHTQGRLYSTAVQTTYGVIVNPPSPTTATQGRSGAASCAPRTPPTPKPMEE